MNNSLVRIEASKRDVLGKQVGGRRRAGLIPANIVAKGKPSLAIEIPLSKLTKALDQVGYTQVLELVVDKEKRTVLVTDVTFAPIQDIPEHVVFFEFQAGEKIQASVPLVLSGESTGEQYGLMVLQILHHLEVTAPALKIPEQLDVDISSLMEDGDVVRIEDIKLPAEVETDIDLQTPIVKLEMSRSQVSQTLEEETDEAADGEEQGEASADDQASDSPAEA